MLAALVGALALVAPPGWMCLARFSPLPAEWMQGNLGPGEGQGATTEAFAHTRGFHNLNDIPASGIYVSADLSRRVPTSPAPSARRPLRLPLRITHPDQISSQEGAPLPEYRFAGRYRRLYYVDVRVDFGRKRPTGQMLARTQELLLRLRLPSSLVRSSLSCKRA